MNKLKIKRTKQEKGITLIALIITIVVLLILAVVAIRAVTGDKILEYATNARDSYQQAQENEEAMLQNYLEIINEDNQNGSSSNEDNAEDDLLEKYILGAEKTGRPFLDIIDTSTGTFVDEESTIANASTAITILPFLANTELCIKYNNKAYKVLMNDTTYMTTDLEKVYEPEGKEGTTVKYDSNEDDVLEDWVIITDRSGILEIVSADTMYDEDGNGLTLGYGDTSVTVTSDLDGDEEIGDNGDIAIASYNNAITRINNFCDEIVTATNNDKVRSVGASIDTAGEYSGTNFDAWFKGTVSVKAGDTNYKEDLIKMYFWGIATNIKYPYWLAYRQVNDETDNGSTFYIHYMDVNGTDYGTSLWSVNSSGDVWGANENYGVRPVVINPTGI